jgi:hypothetical protein
MMVAATVADEPAHDPGLGFEWRKVCFESDGRLGVRTQRGIFRGRYTFDPSTNAFTAKFDPEPLPPRPRAGEQLSDAQRRRLNPESFGDYRWPVEVQGTYRREADRLVISGRRENEAFEWVMAPYLRVRY